MSSQFSPKQFFDLTEFPFKEIFNGVSNVWDVLPKITPFIEDQFKNGKIKGNYKENIFIGEGVVIDDSASIKGPAVIGNNCTIGHAAFLRDGCILGNNVHIGHAVEIKNSLILNSAAIAHLNYIGNSVIGNFVNFSGGSIAANFRLDKKLVIVRNNDEKIETGLEKFGCVIGDSSNIGVNVVLNPGTLLGKNTVVYPLHEVRGVHTEGEVIK